MIYVNSSSFVVSPLVKMFRPSPCPLHYDGRLATMPSADFCLITERLTPLCAIGFHLFCSFQSMTLESQGTCIPEPHWLFTDRLLSRSPQIRACTFSALLHHLRWPLDHMVSLSWTQSASRGRPCQLTFSLRLI